METEILSTTETKAIVAVLESQNLPKSRADQIEAIFTPMVAKLREFDDAFNAIVAEPITKELTIKAKRLRLDIAKVRTEAEHNRKEAERKAELERIARQQAEEEERERVRLENEKLRAEAVERERIENERRAKEAADKAKLEAKLKKEREAAAAKLEAERKERERIEAELRAKQEAEESARREEAARIKREQEAREAAERAAAAAPDKEKLMKLAASILSIELPKVESHEAQRVLVEVENMKARMAAFIENHASTLGQSKAA